MLQEIMSDFFAERQHLVIRYIVSEALQALKESSLNLHISEIRILMSINDYPIWIFVQKTAEGFEARGNERDESDNLKFRVKHGCIAEIASAVTNYLAGKLSRNCKIAARIFACSSHRVDVILKY